LPLCHWKMLSIPRVDFCDFIHLRRDGKGEGLTIATKYGAARSFLARLGEGWGGGRESSGQEDCGRREQEVREVQDEHRRQLTTADDILSPAGVLHHGFFELLELLVMRP
jgi:hypothetical protein